jgi:acetyltransferase-like isoleucine patch superfamily enzyme
MHTFHPGKHEVLFYLKSNGFVVERTEFEIRIEQIISEPETATVQTQRYDGMIIEDQYNIGRGSYHSFIPQIRSMKPWTINVGNFSSISTVTLSLSRTMAHRKSFITTFPLHQLVNRHSLYEDEIVSGSSHTVNIGNDVWIGADVVLINNITIGDGAVIGSHSVVRDNIPPYAIVYGNPATVQKYRFNDTMIAKLLSMQWWGWEDERVLQMAKYRKMEDVVAAWERGEI